MCVSLQCLNKTLRDCDNLSTYYTVLSSIFRSCFCGPSFSCPSFSVHPRIRKSWDRAVISTVIYGTLSVVYQPVVVVSAISIEKELFS